MILSHLLHALGWLLRLFLQLALIRLCYSPHDYPTWSQLKITAQTMCSPKYETSQIRVCELDSCMLWLDNKKMIIFWIWSSIMGLGFNYIIMLVSSVLSVISISLLLNVLFILRIRNLMILKDARSVNEWLIANLTYQMKLTISD